MDELDLLISKWGTMKLWQKVLLVIIVVGPILFTLNQGHELYQWASGDHTQKIVVPQPQDVKVHIDVSGGQVPSKWFNVNLSMKNSENKQTNWPTISPVL